MQPRRTQPARAGIPGQGGRWSWPFRSQLKTICPDAPAHAALPLNVVLARTGSVTPLILALVSGGLAGYGMSSDTRVRRTHSIAFAAVLTATIYVIVDLELPRAGLIRIDAADQLLVDVREWMR